MKVFFKKIYQLDPGYQEILIDENNFLHSNYTDVSPSKQIINGLTYEDVFVLEPLNYYKVILSGNTPYEFNKFIPSKRLLEVGLVLSSICTDPASIFIYNATQNHIFIRSKAIIGEIE